MLFTANKITLNERRSAIVTPFQLQKCNYNRGELIDRIFLQHKCRRRKRFSLSTLSSMCICVTRSSITTQRTRWDSITAGVIQCHPLTPDHYVIRPRMLRIPRAEVVSCGDVCFFPHHENTLSKGVYISRHLAFNIF